MQLPVEQTITIGGTPYRLSKLDINVMGEFLSWASSKLPDPFDRFAERFGTCSEAIQKMAFERAERLAERRGTLEDPDAMGMMKTIPGVKKLVGLMLKQYHPNLTEDQVGRLIEDGIAEKGDAFTASLFPDLGPGVGQDQPKS